MWFSHVMFMRPDTVWYEEMSTALPATSIAARIRVMRPLPKGSGAVFTHAEVAYPPALDRCEPRTERKMIRDEAYFAAMQPDAGCVYFDDQVALMPHFQAPAYVDPIHRRCTMAGAGEEATAFTRAKWNATAGDYCMAQRGWNMPEAAFTQGLLDARCTFRPMRLPSALMPLQEDPGRLRPKQKVMKWLEARGLSREPLQTLVAEEDRAANASARTTSGRRAEESFLCKLLFI